MEILYNIFGNILEILIIFLGIEGLHNTHTQHLRVGFSDFEF